MTQCGRPPGKSHMVPGSGGTARKECVEPGTPPARKSRWPPTSAAAMSAASASAAGPLPLPLPLPFVVAGSVPPVRATISIATAPTAAGGGPTCAARHEVDSAPAARVVHVHLVRVATPVDVEPRVRGVPGGCAAVLLLQRLLQLLPHLLLLECAGLLVVALRLVKCGARDRLQLGAACAGAALEELIGTLPAAEVGLAYSWLALRQTTREPGKFGVERRCLVVVSSARARHAEHEMRLQVTGGARRHRNVRTSQAELREGCSGG
eukprot:scaffold137463_cov139-Phaeocystis_antarctica.AAC.1